MKSSSSKPLDNKPGINLLSNVCFNLSPHHLMLTAIIFWVWGANAIWMTYDIRPPGYDQAGHLRYTLHYWQALTSGSENWWIDLLNVEPFYPPFFHLFMVPLSSALGFSLETGIIVNSFYLTLTILATYGIGNYIYNRNVGLIASFILACYPSVINFSREYMIVTMLTAIVTLAYWLFLKSENFENRKYSILFSLVYASGLMIKWGFLIYTLPAVLAGLFAGSFNFRQRAIQAFYYLGMITCLLVLPMAILLLGEYRWIPLIIEISLISLLVRYFPKSILSPQKVINLVILTCTSTLICFPWYAHNLVNTSIGMSKFAFPSEVLKGNMTWDLPIWFYYFEIAGIQMGIPLFLLFLVTLVLYPFKQKNFNFTILAWVLVPIIIATFINNKGDRYTMPCLSAMALISAVGFETIKSLPLRKGLYFIFGAMGIITTTYSGFSTTGFSTPYIGGNFFGHSNPPIKDGWQIERILDDMLLESPPTPGSSLTARTLVNQMFFHRGAFRDSAEIRDLPIIVKSVKRNVGEMTDFFITKTGDFGNHAFQNINPKLTRLLNDPALTNTFTTYKTYPLPDGSEGLVIKRQVQPAHDLPGINDLEEIGKRFISAFANYPIYGIKNAVNAQIKIVPTENPDDLYLGHYKKIIIKADSVVSNKIKIEDFELILEDIQINIYDLLLNNKLILFELGRLTPKGTLNFDSLEHDAHKAMKEKGRATIKGFNNGLLIHANYTLPQGQKLEASAKIKFIFSPGKYLKPVVEYIKFPPLDIPEIFFRKITGVNINLTATPGWPLETNIHTIRIHPRKLEINPDSY